MTGEQRSSENDSPKSHFSKDDFSKYHFSKYHGLGNDYLVLDGAAVRDWGAFEVGRVCDRTRGVGSDGLLLHEASTEPGVFALRIINPDGSEAEKSGNGLRIFARYLFDRGLVASAPFDVSTLGGKVRCEVQDGGASVRVEMGRVSFSSRDIPVEGSLREVLCEHLEVGGVELEYSAATIGNPHCVVFRDELAAEEVRQLGPLIENAARFPNRTNVQFARVLDRRTLAIEIWERGAGYTLASGSSSCAAAAVAHRLDLCDAELTVVMPGGELCVEISSDFSVVQHGPVVHVADGVLSAEGFERT